jgi:hypothetical protein
MSFNVKLNEKPRVFNVEIGYKIVGYIKSHNFEGFKSDTDDDELYHAVRVDDSEESGKHKMGWYKTMDEATQAILEYDYGSSKVTKIIERPV